MENDKLKELELKYKYLENEYQALEERTTMYMQTIQNLEKDLRKYIKLVTSIRKLIDEEEKEVVVSDDKSR